MTTIDLNADLGEGDACDEALLGIVTSCNVACGGHAGDTDSMVATVRLALRAGVAIGAHPSYPDRQGFGRRSGFLRGDALYESLAGQAADLEGIAAELGARLTHLKPHGALYNDAATDRQLADVVTRVADEMHGRCRLLGPPASALAAAAAEHGVGFVAEGFVDRAYAPDGRLVARPEPGAVHRDIEAIRAQAVSLAVHGSVRTRKGDVIRLSCDTLCIHGDTEGADVAALAVREALEEHGVKLRSFAG